MNSGIKSLLSPRGMTQQSRRQNTLPSFKTPSRINVSGRLNQSTSQILCKTPNYVVEQFGSQLPVLITEALKFSDGNSAASVNISSEGWAWFVCGRRLLVWQAGGARPVNAQCRELSLPPSDLAHRAHLVTVYTQQASQMPCCLAVSPEGIVRYWSSIAHESSWIEVNAELQGQECDSLHLLLPLGALLVTTTATLVLVTPHFAAARHALLCRSIKTPHGWLGGISRRMSSLIFGSIPATQIMETKLVKVVTRNTEAGEWTVVVLAGHSLQKWQLCTGQMELLLFEADLARPLREAFFQYDHDAQELFLLDMQASEVGVMLLIAAASQDTSQVTYALVAVKIESYPVSVCWFRELTAEDLGPLYLTAQGDSALQFLIMGQVALVYNSAHIVAIPVLSGKGDVELLDFGHGQIIDGALYGHVPVFFSTFNGFISVSSTETSQSEMSSIMTDILPDSGISDSNIEELTQQKDNVGLLKASFLLYIRKQQAQSKAALANLFSGQLSNIEEVLSTAVLQTSLELINDVPAKDPRWADQKSTRLSIGSSNSLQIVHQLEEKQRVLQWYVSFLKDMKLWDKLSNVTHANRLISATYVLQEHAEKVVATLALKKAHPKYVDLVDKIIEDVLSKHRKKPFGSLTNQDLFYAQASLIHEAINQLVRWTKDLVFKEQNSHVVVTQLALVNTLLLEMLKAVSDLRDAVGSMYQPADPGVWEKKLWTLASGPESIGDSLLLQMQITVNHGVKSAGDPQQRAELLDQLLTLVDFVLDGRKCHVESLRHSPLFTSVLQQYEADRLAYIQLFMAEEEYERAAMLAEKYLDFQILIDICEKTSNKDKLNFYIEKFNGQGFSKFLFTWYIREQKQSTLVQHCSERGGEELVPLLSEHPSLSWLHDLALHQYKKVSETLKSLAQAETQLLQRKKTQLSLAKLALLASSDPPGQDLDDVNSALTLITFQEHLPESLLTSYGYDSDNIRLFSPSELIKLYISDENPSCTEFTFKTALDILTYVEDNQERSELNSEIWCKAVMKDTWIDMDPNSPQLAIQQLFFFKLFDLCILEGCEDMVPSIEELLSCEELGHLKDNSTFHYLLQVGYEHFSKDSVMANL